MHREGTYLWYSASEDVGDGREILQMVPVDGRIQYAKFKMPETEKLPTYQFPWDK